MTDAFESVRVRVLDPDGNPVPEASVRFTDAPVPVPDIAGLADDKGEVVMAAPAPGHYGVGVLAEGFEETISTVEVAAHADNVLEVRLRPEPR